ncbi:MAG: ADP-ribosylglycohydrolase family protein [Gemmatimonadaceae bacterium]
MTERSTHSAHTPAPHGNSYVVPDTRIVGGEYPGALDRDAALGKIRAILDAGVTLFIDLTEGHELDPYEPMLREEAAARGLDIEYVRLPVRDLGVPDAAHMMRVLDLLDGAERAGRGAYVHCWGGVGRTGTVIGCWLARRGMSGDAALAEVARLFGGTTKGKGGWQRSPETQAQCDFVRGWPDEEARRRRSALGSGGRRTREHFRGCLLGGAVGDALGAPVEFVSLAQIRSRYGPEGIRDFDEAYGRVGAITDDTQMTLFTAEGLLRAEYRGRQRGVDVPPPTIWHAYHRWLLTQGERSKWKWEGGPERDGWLIGVRALHARRAPGTTCLAALRGDVMGTPDRPLNDSKGCGGVMRVAPVGLASASAEAVFRMGCEVAALTHGHPSGFLAAGCLALIVHQIIAGLSLDDAARAALERVRHEPAHEETARALEGALRAARASSPTAETVEGLGAGWVAEEALGIAVYAALAADGSFEDGVRLAVNHTGDSDSTGAIAGNILGALLGAGAIPERWREGVELRTEIETLADDLLVGFRDDEEWWEKYPGW